MWVGVWAPISLILVGIALISITVVSEKEALIRIPKGSNLSIFDMFALLDVTCGNDSGGAYRGGNVDTFKDKDCTSKQMVINFYEGSDLSTIKQQLIINDKSTPTIQYEDFLALPVYEVKSMTPLHPQDLRLALSAGHFEFILTQDNDTSSGYAAVYNSPDEEERPRFFFVKYASDVTLDHNQSLLGELECWTHAYDEYDLLEIKMKYDDSCKETNATITYADCENAVEEELCDCECAYFDKMKLWETLTAFDNRTEEAKEEKLKTEMGESKQKLTVNKTALSSGKSKKISAGDTRPSATNIGILGTLMLALVVGSLLVCDLLSIKRHIRSVRKHR